MTPSHAKPALKIAGTGIYLPKKVLTNDDLETLVSTTDEWITSRTGIKERRLAAPDENVADMSAQAAMEAIRRADITPEDIDLIMVATFTSDHFFPSAACFVQHKIGAKNAAAFDLQAACTGFLYGLTIANSFILSGKYKNILLIGAEKLSSIVNWQDRNTCVLFGDGAGAVVLQASHAGKGVISWRLGANGTHHEMLHMKNNYSKGEFGKVPTSIEPSFMHMSGKEVFKQAVTEMANAATTVMQEAGCSIDDLRCVISHQANMRIIDALAERLKVPSDKCFVNLQRYGNISAACIPVALREAEEHYHFKRGDKILLVAFGGGLTWAALVIEW